MREKKSVYAANQGMNEQTTDARVRRKKTMKTNERWSFDTTSVDASGKAGTIAVHIW